jgi:AraC-like DNA-binding protein
MVTLASRVAAAASSPATSWVDFTINTVGFSFRKGQAFFRAKELLSAGRSRVEIAHALGFASQSHFRLFVGPPACLLRLRQECRSALMVGEHLQNPARLCAPSEVLKVSA